MSADEEQDLLIVGAGMAGAALAGSLPPGLRVALLEAEDVPGYHSTGRSAAMTIANYGPPAVRALTRASRAFLEAPPEGFAGAPLLAPRGLLLLAYRGQEALLEQELAGGDDLERLSPSAAGALVPVLRPEALAAAAYEAEAADIEVAALHQGFLARFRRNGGRLLTKCRVESLRRRGGRWEVSTTAGRFSAPLLANAAGAWADRLAEAAGLPPLGLVPRRRSAAILPLPAGLDPTPWPLFGDVAERWYAKPEAGRLLVSPADADPVEPQDAFPDELVLAEGLARFEAAVTFPVTRVERRWAGLRTFAPDGGLVIGFDSSAEGFFWVAGQGGYGIQTAPAAGALAAALLLGEAPPALLTAAGVAPAALRPARFRREASAFGAGA